MASVYQPYEVDCEEDHGPWEQDKRRWGLPNLLLKLVVKKALLNTSDTTAVTSGAYQKTSPDALSEEIGNSLTLGFPFEAYYMFNIFFSI